MMVLGITGPTGSGKTTALRVLERMGFEVIDCDALYYRLLKEDDTLRRDLTAAFGEIFLPDGSLDRKKLGAIVFEDPKALQRLNRIIFPVIDRSVGETIAASKSRGVVVDAINLIESGIAKRCDVVLGVTAPPEVRLRRIMERDNIDEAYARSRIAAQKDDKYYKKHCTFVLENRAGSEREFSRLVKEFIEDILIMEEL